MKVAAIRIELHVGDAQSLKEKRSVLRPVIEGLRNRLSISVAEVGYQDTWQRSAIGAALVARDMGELERMIDQTRRHFDSQVRCEMVAFTVSHMEEPGE
jgi:uncharacterized protein YlxP (DUF503 family)